ncbi:RagB/SusD family nutrient uptake outer membrane protein [Mucilaginibacter sp. Bleaf8]|uniref:RagB/SusD family nutrient uptake outer membrane protein n=1 Tax=Mucilaginibacter sp. Bleaf8 TaxID=2834430 RepID=UPI001BCB293F|nr:RagB/SusD family nutrient uptake outer membrane protein [Mucilaginibacter sp. Bleaf8]MBS7563021.1 RagB/SusD family nutrient uptake outer membrane protein [Mucilaginibacter sp. Bleaf8]
MFLQRINFIKIALGIGLVAVVTAGCKKLDQEPKDSALQGPVFGSQNGLDLYANSFYNILPTAGTILRGDAMSDYCARTTVPDFLRPGAYGPQQSTGWGTDDWRPLRNINYFIQNNNSTAVSQSVRENYTGLARFFRAWFYFDKIKRFGDVPWIGKPINANDQALYNGRDSRALVMDSVIADLDYACQHITQTNANRSLITKYVAYAFKSRVCLFEGTFRKYHDEYKLQSSANGLLQQAVDAAQKVISEGGFSINTSGGTSQAYRQLFSSQVPVANETILAAVMDPGLSVYSDANWYWTSATYGDRLSLIRTFVNTYLNIDGTPFTSKSGYQTMPFTEEVKGRDMRLQQTIRMGNYTRNNGGTQEAAPPVFSYTYTGYQPIKLTQDDASMDGGTRNTNSLPIIRYAEILLNFAEAKAELGTLTDADWNMSVGALRRRAGITGNTNTKPALVDTYLQTNYFPGISDPALLEVRRERGIELVLEGFRFYDIVRWKRGPLMDMTWNGFYVPALNQLLDLNEDGKPDVCFYKGTAPGAVKNVTYVNVATTLSNGTTNPQRITGDNSGELTWLTTVPRQWNDKFYLYPIPEAERLRNPNLGQNPGW